ncbi:hypothetical protein GbCGDNIH2_2322 [Granulibacter bethesdensis]|uniref:Uncharacterized protein n=1 Tax=Granulibacter bethesdensis (strain ATCC BAA-1260 / CGDNIH1) TaxID=391165 RepID=Q0BPN2_GRABC|nr:hypothetical protein GbCGDNIH1_2322 [Granulibacter bethesdensis CGDNIH1]APG30754.1 hypothetical protein GbCGDNIH2_2322 [Granulibacter bethesdensis]APH65787.1 hypothetical protein GbCGDNIH1I4_2322 [Granulibacter bethesdensis]
MKQSCGSFFARADGSGREHADRAGMFRRCILTDYNLCVDMRDE